MNHFTIIITMAGEGNRFRKAGFTEPKHKIAVRGRSLFEWSLRSLLQFVPITEQIVFIARREHDPETFILREATRLGFANPAVHLLDAGTDGQATTAMLAGSRLMDLDMPLLIYNIDTYVEPDFLHPAMFRGDGWVPCFRATGERWSFASFDEENGLVVDIAEKRRISENATIGLYGFRSFRFYEQAYREHYASPLNIDANERYIAPIYRTVISRRGLVFACLIPQQAVHVLGTPEELTEFSASP